MAGATGLEPATSGVTGRRSNQTELHPRIRKPSIGCSVNSVITGTDSTNQPFDNLTMHSKSW